MSGMPGYRQANMGRFRTVGILQSRRSGGTCPAGGAGCFGSIFRSAACGGREMDQSLAKMKAGNINM